MLAILNSKEYNVMGKKDLYLNRIPLRQRKCPLIRPVTYKRRRNMATKDMSTGNPMKVLYAFAVPMIISVLFQQFYNIADSLIAGNFILDGGGALAAVNAAYPVTVVFIAVGNGFGVGGSVVISRLFGSKNFSRTKTAAKTAIINILVFASIFTLIGILTSKPLLSLMNSQDLGEEVFAQSVDYLNIYIYGLIFLFVYNVVSSIPSARQFKDSSIPARLFHAVQRGDRLYFRQILRYGSARTSLGNFYSSRHSEYDIPRRTFDQYS